MTFAAVDPVTRFGDQVLVGDGCWEWQGSLAYAGYGRLRVGPQSRSMGAHRYSYELLVGPIPEGLEIHHKCMNPPCVNPAHLEPVTREENLRMRRFYRPTHCKRGHAFDEHNTYFVKTGGRQCRKCCAWRMRQYKASLKAA